MPQDQQGPQDSLWDYGPDGAADAAAELQAPQYLTGTTGRTDPPVGYAGVHRGKRTTRPRCLPGAGQRVSPIIWILSQASTRQSTDRARAILYVMLVF